GLAPPQIARAVVAHQRPGLRPDHAHVDEAQQLDQLLAIRLRLGEQLAGVEEDHRRRGIHGRDHVEEHRALGAERRDQRGAAGERPLLEQRPKQREAVLALVRPAQIVEMLEHVQSGCPPPTAGPRAWRRPAAFCGVDSYAGTAARASTFWRANWKKIALKDVLCRIPASSCQCHELFRNKLAGAGDAMDQTDRQILALLQEDATMPVAEVARRVGLSATPCWRRIQKLEEAKIIRRRVALVDSRKVNVGVTAFVFVRTNQHGLDWLERFAEAVRDLPEVVEFYRMSGQVDYLLKVVVPDIEAYDRFYKKLISKIELADVSSSFAMEQIKYTTALPLDYA